jgi:uncharacterized membrane protein
MAPPDPPVPTKFADEDGRARLRFRLWQATAAAATILTTGWLIMLGPVPAVCGLLVAKHVLVAILVMGVGLDAPLED